MKKLKLIDINNSAVDIVKSIRILEHISWPSSLEKEFFSQIQKGNSPNLKFKYRKADFKDAKLELTKLDDLLSVEDPLHIYTSSMIKSYLNAIELVNAAGSSHFQDLSIQEYGRPGHMLFGSNYSHLDTANKILQAHQEFDHPYVVDSLERFSSSDLRKYLKDESKKVFKDESPKFQIIENMTAKASASKSKIKIRKEALFTKYDFDQLLVHEVMTHTLTGINGSLQKTLTIMGQGAPRTTKTQEGLATFSEVITGTMDLARLKRLALRVIAIDMALAGADFYDLYYFFIKNDQSEQESFLSSSRIFRGGSAKGGIVFTKDGTYLEGLIRVHSFFRWAFKTRNLELTHLLFCGKIDINDVFLLNDAYKSLNITEPKFLPKWYQDIDLLAGKMAFSNLLNKIDLTTVDNHYSSKLSLKAA
jgi:uncharacterized protein (TIGR02421 family)